MMRNEDVLRFCHWLSGSFGNFKQAQSKPAHFAHIKIFFRPLDWNIFQGPAFYSEQSYEYDPWRPYRQGLHRLEVDGDKIKLHNFGISDSIRYAGSGFAPELLQTLQPNLAVARLGCAMEFTVLSEHSFSGIVEPGCRCLVPRDGRLTYLVSEVELGKNYWISRDRGFDPSTHEYRWGSEHGKLEFQRLEFFGNHLDASWLSS